VRQYKRIPFAAHIKGDLSTGFAGVTTMKKIRLPVATNASRGFKGFIGWMQEVHPRLYSIMTATEGDFIAGQENARSSGSMLSGLGLVDPSTNIMGQEVSPGSTVSASSPPTGSVVDQFIQSVTRAAAVLLPLSQQQKVLNLQLQRAKAGLPPLNVGAYIDQNSGINVGVTPATQKTLLYLGGGLAAAWVLTRFLKHR
jgi:hypothetical protein